MGTLSGSVINSQTSRRGLLMTMDSSTVSMRSPTSRSDRADDRLLRRLFPVAYSRKSSAHVVTPVDASTSATVSWAKAYGGVTANSHREDSPLSGMSGRLWYLLIANAIVALPIWCLPG